jgi:hypothetical protein
MLSQARCVVTFFYMMSAYLLYDGSRNLSHLDDPLESLDLLWPVAWFADIGVRAGGQIVAQVGLAAALLGIVWWRLLPVRILVSAALLLYAAYANSHGAINHGHHEWFWISICFWFLPGDRAEALAATRAGRMRFLTAFSLAPLLILFFYSLSGFYKCEAALDALLAGRTGGFSPDAMAITVAWRAIQTGAEPMWAAPVLEYPLLGWGFYTGLYFIELVSVLVFFRPQLHRSWGLLLISFHFGTLLFMDITFASHVLINGMLFVMSPFALGKHRLQDQLIAVPVFGRLVRPFLREYARSKPKPRAPEQEQGGVPAKS